MAAIKPKTKQARRKRDRADVIQAADSAIATLGGHRNAWDGYTAGQKADAVDDAMAILIKVIRYLKSELE